MLNTVAQYNETLFSMKYLVIVVFCLMGIFISSCQQGKQETENTNTMESLSADTLEAVQDLPSPLRKITGVLDGVTIEINYSSPGVKDRVIWGDLEPYNQVWRMGANAATTIEFSEDVLLEGERLPAGKYALFSIPRKEGPWTIIFNKEWDQWGAYNYHETLDALRIEVEPLALDAVVERLRFDLDESAKKIVFSWEKVMLPIEIAAAEV